MRLRSKLMAITALGSVLPILAGTLVVRQLVERESRAEFTRLLRDGEQEVRARYRALQAEVVEAVALLADPEDDFTGQILIGLAQGGLDDDAVRRLAHSAPRVMRQRGLDALTVVGPGQRVLASGHFPGRIGDTAAAAPAGATGAVLAPERAMRGERAVTQLTVQAWRWARSQLGSAVRVMGGRALDGRFLRRLRLRGDTEALLADAHGGRLAGPEQWARYAGYPRRVVRLQGSGGAVVARVTLAVPDDRLRTTLRVINYAASGLIGVAVLLSLLLGGMARRISRPLEELAAGAEAVAGGDLERQIPVRSHDEVGELVATFNRMTGQLKDSQERAAAAERVAAWREIAQRIAHEIKNPLSPIQTSIETLRKVHRKKHPSFEEIFEESTTTILEEVARLKKIVGEFSSFARMPKPTLSEVDLAELVRGVVALHQTEQLPIALELPVALPPVLVDREQITQVLVNLLSNAREALGETAQPRLTVGLSRGAGAVELRVEDNGSGFDQQTAAKLFTPYFTTKGSSGGSGLGLAIVHRIVSDHGGSIEARSNAPARPGATFVVRLPLREPA